MAFGTDFADERGHFIIAAAGRPASPASRSTIGLEPGGLAVRHHPGLPRTGAGRAPRCRSASSSTMSASTNGHRGRHHHGVAAPRESVAIRETAFGALAERRISSCTATCVADPVMGGGQWRASTIRGTDLRQRSTSSRLDPERLHARELQKSRDNVELFAQGLWAHNQNHNWCCATEDNATITLKDDNAFIPARRQGAHDDARSHASSPSAP